MTIITHLAHLPEAGDDQFCAADKWNCGVLADAVESSQLMALDLPGGGQSRGPETGHLTGESLKIVVDRIAC
jgi:hypothetical protein